ncbi:MAG: glycosyltransferase family 2 protein [bacterium]|nr:glycosyltransferase family 2 protein [bacterium]
MKLAVGFITYNEATAKYLDDFLPSLEAALSFLKSDAYRVYVFDNSAKANLLNSRILWRHQKIEYFCLGHNFGFAYAYNVLIRKAIKDGADYFLVVNPDTIMEPEAIRNLIAALDNDDSLGSVAPKILCWNFSARKKTKTIDSLGLTLKPGLKFSDLGQGREDQGRNEAFKILGPSGAAGLFRLSALEKVAATCPGNREIRPENRESFPGSQPAQYFDERFFMYKEDCDLAYRLFLAGFGSRLVSSAIIYHDRTAAVSGRGIKNFWRGRQSKSKKIRAWSFRNQHLIFLKHWKKQNLVNKIIVILRVLSLFIFSLILEQFLLKEYFFMFRQVKGLTNIK